MGKKRKKERTEFTCGACQHVFTPNVKAGEGVTCPECGSSHHLSSRAVEDEAGSDDKDNGGSE